MEHQVRGRGRHIERLQVGLAARDVAIGDGQDEGGPRLQDLHALLRGRPALAVPAVVGLADPVRRPLGPHPHDDGPPELAPNGGIEPAGKAEITTDADLSRRAPRPGKLGRAAGVSGQPAGPAHRAPGTGLSLKRHPDRQPSAPAGGERRWPSAPRSPPAPPRGRGSKSGRLRWPRPTSPREPTRRKPATAARKARTRGLWPGPRPRPSARPPRRARRPGPAVMARGRNGRPESRRTGR